MLEDQVFREQLRKELVSVRKELADLQLELNRDFGSPRYANTSGETDTIKLMRVEDFLVRHNLYRQFLAEDADNRDD